ncbi:SNase-domain-containing protein [Mytilinidion resinicola]|uniref:Probable endonuclease LCL3 n=1 Tax=Mytilinidion resinicola TaxID=574789 RepID=A0A6A6YFU0_9PEZI|nr:SNase-domain-containing protein [Mytilinidion resinicola]KAF2806884.1 SNase-domain-containing protein [Mytilinidion resinicola]
MRWPWSQNPHNSDDGDSKRPVSWAESLNATDWSQYTEARTVVPSVLLTITTLTLIRLYKSYLRRIPSVNYIKPDLFRRRSLFGKVTSVGDADNFRFFHTPGGRIAGWGWLPWKMVPKKREELSAKTLHIRIAGIDAPEMAHFGHPAQPYSKEAYDWLSAYILNRRVRAKIYRRDQYDRVIATVFVRKGLFRRDVGLEMLKSGLATIYEAKSGSEFGQFEEKYRKAEKKARLATKGIWTQPSLWERLRGQRAKDMESPREYKTRMATSDKTEVKKTEVKKAVVKK